MTTTVISTIRSSGGDYTTLSAWEAGEQGDLVSADEIRVAEFYDDWPSGLNNATQINGWTTDSTRYVKVTVAEGHRHDGTFATGFFFAYSSNYGNVIDIRKDYTVLEHLAFDLGFTGGTSSSRATYVSGITYATYINCIARNSTNGHGSAFMLPSSGVAINCLANNVYQGFSLSTNSAVYNCVAANCGYRDFSGGGASTVAKNTVSYNNTSIWAGAWDTTNSSHNATSSGSDDAPGGYSVYGVTSAAFVNAASNDFHLASGSVLIGAGTNLYSTFTTDIDGDTWPSSGAWDIGFDYRVSGATTYTHTASLSAAIQQARTATASLSAAIQTNRTASASAGMAIQQAFTASATLDAAIQRASTATASLDAYVIAAGSHTATSSLGAAIQQARSATASLDAAIAQALAASAGVDAAISAGHTASASLDAYVQVSGSGIATASLGAAIQQAHAATATLGAAVQTARSASAGMDAALAVGNSASAGLDSYIYAGSLATASLDAAIMAAASASVSLSAYIVVAGDTAALSAPRSGTYRNTSGATRSNLQTARRPKA